jgi:DNA (cytosine-5)-methyltransferase 1
MTTPIKFIDLFCGIGGIRQGMDYQGFECVFSSDINAECQRTYKENFDELPFGDITQIDEKTIPSHDILCAGFPCQPFSISGKQKGFADTRGTLFFDICRIINEKKPSVVFLENVKHLVHHDGGKTLQTILDTLASLGYNVSWRVLNGADYGVPQNRERIIIVGSINGKFDFDKVKTVPRRRLLDFLDADGEFEYLDPSDYTLISNPKQQPGSGLIFAGYRNKSIRKVGVDQELNTYQEYISNLIAFIPCTAYILLCRPRNHRADFLY